MKEQVLIKKENTNAVSFLKWFDNEPYVFPDFSLYIRANLRKWLGPYVFGNLSEMSGDSLIARGHRASNVGRCRKRLSILPVSNGAFGALKLNGKLKLLLS